MMDHVTERAAALWDAGARWDEILEALRNEAFSKVDCIRATVEILRLAPGRRQADRPPEPSVGRPPGEGRRVPRHPGGGVHGGGGGRLTARSRPAQSGTKPAPSE